jgi:hypothetical protein
MEQKLEFGNCYYKPSFFNMKVDLPIDLMKLDEIPEGAMGLYYHEYIHFIQDISTIYGLMNISTINYYIQACAHHIQKDKSNYDFKVPLNLKDIVDKTKTEDKGLINFNLRPLYIGSSISTKSKNIEDFQYNITKYEFEENKFIDKVNISFIDSLTKEKRQLEFGGNQVTEGMAYLSEQYNFANILPIADEYPYLIVQKLVESIYPEILEDKLLIIVLCDISLMTYHPGLSFIRLLKHAKTIDITEIPLDDIYKECLKHIKGSNVGFNELVDNVKLEINKNFNAEYYNDITDWIDTIFDRIKIIRRDIPSFFIDLVRFGKPNENNFFKLLLNSVGSPLVINSESDGSISLPFNFKPTGVNFNPGIFMAINQVLRIFYSEKPSACLLKDYCLKSKETDLNLNVDSNCDTAPWKKANEKNLCPVGQIWHHWALKDYSPKYEIKD